MFPLLTTDEFISLYFFIGEQFRQKAYSYFL